LGDTYIERQRSDRGERVGQRWGERERERERSGGKGEREGEERGRKRTRKGWVGKRGMGQRERGVSAIEGDYIYIYIYIYMYIYNFLNMFYI
jgi:hypothetical protein